MSEPTLRWGWPEIAQPTERERNIPLRFGGGSSTFTIALDFCKADINSNLRFKEGRPYLKVRIQNERADPIKSEELGEKVFRQDALEFIAGHRSLMQQIDRGEDEYQYHMRISRLCNELNCTLLENSPTIIANMMTSIKEIIEDVITSNGHKKVEK